MMIAAPGRIIVKRLAFAVIAAASLQLSSCGGSGVFEPRELALELVGAWWPPKDIAANYVIRSEPDWQSVWKTHEPQIYPPPERPRVDFGRHMIVGLTLGTGPNGCHGLRIRRVVEEATEVRVEYRRSVVPPLVGCSQSLIALTDFVIVTSTEKPVIFVRTDA